MTANPDNRNEKLLKALYAGCSGRINGRTVNPPANYFYPIDSFSWVDKVLREHESQDLFFGVATRHGGGTKENIVSISALFLDVDFKSMPVEQADKILQDFPFPPSAIINSGNGYHVYWFLKEPLGKEDIPRFEAMLKRLCQYFGADPAATDASRILRFPGSKNYKYNPPRDVEIMILREDRRYLLEDFDDILPALKAPAQAESRPISKNEQTDALMKCKFMQHCRDHASEVPEPLWFAMVSNAARITPGGPDLVHELSRAYPKYSRQETDAKILHAMNGSGPITCTKIRELGFDCKQRCPAKAPVGLVRPAAATPQVKPLSMAAGPCARTCEDLQQRFSKEVIYVWRNHAIKGTPIMLNGREGTGKSTICLGMAYEILDTHPKGFVLWVACEGQLANTLTQAEEMGLAQNPRFRVAELAPGDYLYRFDRPDHIKKFSELISALKQEAPVLAVFIDSIRGMTGFGDNDSEVGNVMMAVNGAVCDRHGAALVYIDHWKKGKTQGDHSLLDKAVGSTAKTSAVRLVMSVLPASKFKRVLKEAKNNIGKPAPELDVLKAPNGRLIFQESTRITEQSMRDKGEEFLFSIFSERQRIPVNEIADEAEKREIGFDTLKKVKETLGIESVREGDRWYWIWTALL